MIAWWLNLDADLELAGLPAAPQVEQRIRVLRRCVAAVQPGDLVLDAGLRVPPGTLGRAWCPTPRALAALEAAGAVVPEAPPFAVLQRVNDRRFAFELGPVLPGSVVVESLPEAMRALARPVGPLGWLAKRAHGMSGTGHRRFEGALDARDLGWLAAALRCGIVVIEPRVARTADLIVHGFVAGGQLSLGGACVQETTARGGWTASVPAPVGSLSDADLAALADSARRCGEALDGAGYFGPFGIDAMRWDDEGQSRLHPLVELNARFTMGWGVAGPVHPA